ncbi:MAG: HD domain-containing protein [bacterium]
MFNQFRIKSLFVLVFAGFVGFGAYLSYNIFTEKNGQSGQQAGRSQGIPVSGTPVSRTIETLYGTYTIDDPLIIELIDSPALQRMKNVSQHGICSFVDSNEKPYSRYDHSVAVWAILKRFGASRKEQVAGLLHDVSHTVFSHLGDSIFGQVGQNIAHSYQDSIHEWYLAQTCVGDILKKYNFTVHDMNIESGEFTMLDQEYPDLCVDRLEYNLRVGPWVGIIEEKDIEVILQDLNFENNKWFFRTPEIARKFSAISLHFTQHVWGGPEAYTLNLLGTHLLQHAMQIKLVTKEEMHFSTDDVVWKRLSESGDSFIQKTMELIKNYKKTYVLSTPEICNYVVKTKFRGIDPLVKTGVNGEFKRLSEIDSQFAQVHEQAKAIVKNGYPITFVGELAGDPELTKEIYS